MTLMEISSRYIPNIAVAARDKNILVVKPTTSRRIMYLINLNYHVLVHVNTVAMVI
jgi:hypothetical protein